MNAFITRFVRDRSQESSDARSSVKEARNGRGLEAVKWPSGPPFRRLLHEADKMDQLSLSAGFPKDGAWQGWSSSAYGFSGSIVRPFRGGQRVNHWIIKGIQRLE